MYFDICTKLLQHIQWINSVNSFCFMRLGLVWLWNYIQPWSLSSHSLYKHSLTIFIDSFTTSYTQKCGKRRWRRRWRSISRVPRTFPYHPKGPLLWLQGRQTDIVMIQVRSRSSGVDERRIGKGNNCFWI